MSTKIIVTHIFPDLDALVAVWLLQRFDDDWKEAEIKFVAAGLTYQGQAVDSDPTVIHVDTGLGRFDHHQTEERVCAAGLVFNYLKSQKKIALKYQSGLKRLIELVIQIDHFEDFFWSDPIDDHYDLCLHHLLDNLKLSGKLNDKELVYQGMVLLDAVLFGLMEKIRAEEEIKEGTEFTTVFGRSLGVESQVGDVSKLAQKMGFSLVVRKEPETGFVSIKCQPRKDLNLSPVFAALKQADSQADWFFHKSGHIILNGSRHNPRVKPSSLGLTDLVTILKNIK